MRRHELREVRLLPIVLSVRNWPPRPTFYSNRKFCLDIHRYYCSFSRCESDNLDLLVTTLLILYFRAQTRQRFLLTRLPSTVIAIGETVLTCMIKANCIKAKTSRPLFQLNRCYTRLFQVIVAHISDLFLSSPLSSYWGTIVLANK